MLENLEDYDASTDSKQTTFEDRVSNHAPDPDHTMKFVDNSGRVSEAKVAAIMDELEGDNAEQLIEQYEDYRQCVDLQRAIGRAADKSAAYDFYDADGGIDRVADGGMLQDFKPVDGEILNPLFAWNIKRKHKVRDIVEQLPGHLPAYRAIFPEPQCDGMAVFREENIDPSASDSHVWVPQDFIDTFEGEMPPETVAEFKDTDTPEETPTEESDTDERIAICGRAKDDGTPCRTPVANYGESCQHHDGEQLATEVTKDTRELIDDTADTPEEDTSEPAGSDTDDSASRNMDDFKECLDMADGDMDKAKEIYELTH